MDKFMNTAAMASRFPEYIGIDDGIYIGYILRITDEDFEVLFPFDKPGGKDKIKYLKNVTVRRNGVSSEIDYFIEGIYGEPIIVSYKNNTVEIWNALSDFRAEEKRVVAITPFSEIVTYDAEVYKLKEHFSEEAMPGTVNHAVNAYIKKKPDDTAFMVTLFRKYPIYFQWKNMRYDRDDLYSKIDELIHVRGVSPIQLTELLTKEYNNDYGM